MPAFSYASIPVNTVCILPDHLTASTGLYLAYADISILSRHSPIHYFPL